MADKEHNISLSRHRQHKKLNPWRNWLRILLFLIFLLSIVYGIQKMLEKEELSNKEKMEQPTDTNDSTIEIPIALDTIALD